MTTLLEHLTELNERATKGPWHVTEEWGAHEGETPVLCYHGVRNPDEKTVCSVWNLHRENADAVAATRNALPALLECVRALEWLDERFRYRFENCDRKFAQEKIAAALAPFMKEHR